MADDNSAKQPAASVEQRRKGMTELTRRNLAAVKKISEQLASERTASDIAIDNITAFCGSKVFIWIHLAWYGAWVAWNVLAPEAARFDKYPFNFLTLTVSLEAIFLSTFILITQNRQARLADLRSNLDLQINLLGEAENTKMLSMLQAIQEKLGISCEADDELAEMEQQLETEMLAQQIEHIMENTPSSPWQS
jgi:uncharacterized membrane protein